MTPTPKIILQVGSCSITVTPPELRPETVDMVLTDARALIAKIDAATAKLYDMLEKK